MRRRFASAILACAASIALPCLGQNAATFHLKTSLTNSPTDRKLYLAGVDYNGVSYIVDVSDAQPAQMTVWVAKGDGTFQQTWFYQFPSGQNAIPSITSEDLGNGNLDLIAVLSGTNQIAFFAGIGNSTFRQPQFLTISLPPSAPTFDGREAVMADFTGDGIVDLVTSAGSSMVLVPGQSDTIFGPARIIYTAANSQHSVGWSTQLGDFDADGKADLAFTEANCTVSPCSASTLHVDYGDGSGNFTDTTPYSTTGYVFQFNTADLNNDGRTDIAGISESGGVPQLIALYAQSSRTFALHTTSSGLSSTSSSLRNPPIVGDLNGDGANDIAAIGINGSQPALTLFLGDNTPGTFSVETIPLSVPLPQPGVGLVAGDFNSDTKPDFFWTFNTNPGNAQGPLEFVSALNATSGKFTYGCAYPFVPGQGDLFFNTCTVPGSATSPTVFHATSESLGKIHKLELWVDGKKVSQQFHDWADHRIFFNLSRTFPAGIHNATYFSADVDNRLQSYPFPFSVANECSAPSTAGVHVCSPANNSTASSPVKVAAKATVAGTLARMELWVDGVKKYTETLSNSLTTSIAPGPGKHRFTVIAVNTAGTRWSTTVYATVQ